MKPIGVVSTTALFLLLGFSIPTEAGQDQQEKPQKQEQPAKPEKQQQTKPAAQPKQEQQPKPEHHTQQ
jgi:outer membrane biosynthesis protein TonB